MASKKKQMTLDEYKSWVVSVWSSNEGRQLTLRDDFIMTVGLAGETGEVLELLKKAVRDDKLDKDDLILELGDVLYYWCMICARQGISPSTVIKANIKKLEARMAKKKSPK